MHWESTLLLEAHTQKPPQLTHSPFLKMYLQADLVISSSLSSIYQLITSLDVSHSGKVELGVTWPSPPNEWQIFLKPASSTVWRPVTALLLPQRLAVLSLLSGTHYISWFRCISTSSSLITVPCFCSRKGNFERRGPVLYFLSSAACLIRLTNELTWSQLHSQACATHCSSECGK